MHACACVEHVSYEVPECNTQTMQNPQTLASMGLSALAPII